MGARQRERGLRSEGKKKRAVVTTALCASRNAGLAAGATAAAAGVTGRGTVHGGNGGAVEAAVALGAGEQRDDAVVGHVAAGAGRRLVDFRNRAQQLEL